MRDSLDLRVRADRLRVAVSLSFVAVGNCSSSADRCGERFEYGFEERTP